MWICFNDGFISVVNDTRRIDELVVRSRRKNILEKLFPNNEIVTLNISDYKYRTYCSRKEMVAIISDRIMNIDYNNFKNSVDDDELHNLYSNMWTQHYRYQR